MNSNTKPFKQHNTQAFSLPDWSIKLTKERAFRKPGTLNYLLLCIPKHGSVLLQTI